MNLLVRNNLTQFRRNLKTYPALNYITEQRASRWPEAYAVSETGRAEEVPGGKSGGGTTLSPRFVSVRLVEGESPAPRCEVRAAESGGKAESRALRSADAEVTVGTLRFAA